MLFQEPVGLTVEDTVIKEGVLVELPVYDSEGKEVGVDSPVALTLEETLGSTETVREIRLLKEKHEVALCDTVPPPWLLLAPPLLVRVVEGEKVSDKTALAVEEDAPRKEGVGGWELLAELVGEKRRGDSDDVGDKDSVGELEVQPVEEAEREGEEVLEEVIEAVSEDDEH